MSIKTIFVCGSGFMGAGIAQTAICSGYHVILNDISIEVLDKSVVGIKKMLDKSVAKGRMSQADNDLAISRLSVSVDRGLAKQAELVIEAVIERADIKKNIFKELSDICSEDTIFASNTSSISIAEIASVVKNPSRFVGMHFFSPVPLMKLLEIVKGVGTSGDTVMKVKAVGEAWGKKCIVSKDRPAFIVNRMLDPMINEAIELVESGTGSIEDIDYGMRYGLNHPMGPLELIDMVGIDVELSVMEVLYRETGDPKYRPSLLLRDMVRMGWLGRKTGKGFYIYDENGEKVPNADL